MLSVKEYKKDILTHLLTPAGPIPPVQDPDGVYPYESYVETSNRPVIKSYRFVAIENNHLKVEICLDLGGKVYSMVHKKTGKEVLYVPRVTRQTRILPRFYFVAGGIEVSFPISHTPSQNETIWHRIDQDDERIYVSVGERELRYGMHWTVEFSLAYNDKHLTQRSVFLNPTQEEHEWMSWSNAAVPASDDTLLHFPGGPVLVHEDVLKTIQWQKEGPKTNAEISRMSGFFWKKPDCNAFGVFNPSTAVGLYHVASKKEAPGIKLWSYGTGRDKDWACLSSLSKEPYLEIQAGPIADQSLKHVLKPGGKQCHTEYWIPSETKLDIYTLEVPEVKLRPVSKVPLFSWPPCESTQFWGALIKSCNEGKEIPLPPNDNNYLWPPSGMLELGEAFDWIIARDQKNKNSWLYYQGVWKAGKGAIAEAVIILEEANTDLSNALLGRLYYHNKQIDKSKKAFEKIDNTAYRLHPQVVVERDLTLEKLGKDFLTDRKKALEEVEALNDEWILERRINLLVDLREFNEAKELLENIQFQKIHQRYIRKQLWEKLSNKMGQQNSLPPANLGEDSLAVFGAYRAFESQI